MKTIIPEHERIKSMWDFFSFYSVMNVQYFSPLLSVGCESENM